MTDRIPLVNYLVLEDEPHLRVYECTSCGARYFDRRNACAKCSALGFRTADIAPLGKLKAFTIVHRAAPGVEVPFVAAIVDCDGTTVRANLINTPPDADRLTLGMEVRLATYSIGTDTKGTEAIGFGFEPAV